MVGKPGTYRMRFDDPANSAALKRLLVDTFPVATDDVSSYGFIEREFDTDSHEQTMDEVRGIH